MSHLQTSYKIGSVQAVEDFTSWLQDGMDNPTQAPPKLAAALDVLKKAMAKESGCGPKHGKPKRATRDPGPKKSRYQSLRRQMAQKKRKKK